MHREKLKKLILWTSLVVIIEVCLTFIFSWNNTFPIPASNSFLLFFLIPIFIIWIAFFCFLLLSFFKKGLSEAILSAFFERNKISLYISSAVLVFLLLGTIAFFMVADLLEKEIYSVLLPYAVLSYLLVWEIMILFSFTREEFRGKPKYWIGLPLLLAGNYFLRHTLERAGLYLEPYFSKVFRDRAIKVFAKYRWWQFLLPIREFMGYWFFGNILTHFMGKAIGTAGVWYLNQAILMLVAFFLSWKVFRSEILSYFLAICLGFGTHFYNAYQYSSVAGLYLLQTLFILLLYFSYEYIHREEKNRRYLAALIPTLLLTAIFYEGWLDFFSSVWAITIFLYIYFRIKERPQYIKRLLTVFIIFNIVAAIYFYIKFTYIGFAHASGESAVVFAYRADQSLRAIEDLISNYFTQLYMTLTNFLPPAFTTSNALYQYTDYLEKQNNLVLGHYIFYWRYAAGVLATLFFLVFIKVVKQVFKEKPFSPLFPIIPFMIMVAVNGATHTLVQIRIFKTMPLLGYHVQQGVLGLSLCIAYLFYLYQGFVKDKKKFIIISIIAVLIILYSSIRRPNYLWHMMEMVGIDHQGPFPNPFYEVLKIIRGLLPGFLKR